MMVIILDVVIHLSYNDLLITGVNRTFNFPESTFFGMVFGIIGNNNGVTSMFGKLAWLRKGLQ